MSVDMENIACEGRTTSAAVAEMVRLLGAAVLIAAAGLKIVNSSLPLWLRPLGPFGVVVMALGIAAEVSIGGWLLLGFAPRTSNKLAAALFAIFGAIALCLFVRGAKSCGCFGAITVGPLFMMALDVFFAAFFVRWSPIAVKRHVGRSGGIAVVAAGIGVSGLALRGVLTEGALPSRESLIKVDASTMDLGRITEEQAKHIERTFRLFNPTDQAVHIEELARSCTCASAAASAMEIPPRGSVDVKVVVDWAGRRGPQRSDVSVVTKDAFPISLLTVQGTIDAGVVVVPEVLKLGDVPPGQIIRRHVTLARTDGPAREKPLTVVSLASSSPAVRVTGIPAGSADIAGSSFLIEIRTGELEADKAKATIDFRTDYQNGKSVRLRIEYQRLASVQPLAKGLRFRPGELTPQVVRFRRYCEQSPEFRISAGGTGAFAIDSVHEVQSGEETFLDVAVKPLPTNNSHMASKLVCLVSGHEVSSVPLVRF